MALIPASVITSLEHRSVPSLTCPSCMSGSVEVSQWGNPFSSAQLLTGAEEGPSRRGKRASSTMPKNANFTHRLSSAQRPSVA